MTHASLDELQTYASSRGKTEAKNFLTTYSSGQAERCYDNSQNDSTNEYNYTENSYYDNSDNINSFDYTEYNY